MGYDEVLRYVRHYKNDHGEDVPYDVNGVVHLMLAALDNLREHWIDGDLEQIGAAMTPEQRAHFIQIGRFIEDYAADDDDLEDSPG